MAVRPLAQPVCSSIGILGLSLRLGRVRQPSAKDVDLLVHRVYLILRSRVEQIFPEFDLRVCVSDAFAG